MASSQNSWFVVVLMCLIDLAVLNTQLVSCSKLGPASNVLKQLFFPDFRAHNRINHEIRFLGCAGLQENEGIIQIPSTNDLNHNLSFQAGKALYSSPIRMMDPDTDIPASFHTTFSFQIDSNSGSSSGLAFVIVPDEVTVGRPGGWLGMLNDACDEKYKALAVEFDTFKNEEFGDPNDNHIGINLGSIVSNVTIDAGVAGIFFRDGSNVRAWIDYDGVNQRIELSLARDDGSPMPSKPLYSAGLDLSNYLNEYMFVGFSASTGHAAQIHKILSWNFSATSSAFLRLPNETTCERKMFKASKIAPKEPPEAFFVFLAVVGVFLMVLVYFLCNRKAKDQTISLATKLILNKNTARPTPPNKPRRFSMSELSLATRSFSESEILGSGGKGVFYKGVLQNGTLVAVKRFSKGAFNIDKNKIMKEIKVISRLKHPNLVPLKGWCNDKHELVTIYEYMQNGSLDKWLFARGVLPWPRRYKVAKDVAEAICFLHSGWEKNLVHKNIKISNVLLDITFRARLGDFGLVNSADQKPQCLGELKLEHHIPPESLHVLQPTEKMDVYNFGVMLLEIVSGRKSMDHDLSPEEVDLVEFTWQLHENEKLLQVADKRLMMRYNPEQVQCLVGVGLLATQSDPGSRPTMAEIVDYISGEVQLPSLPPCRPVAYFLYPSAPELCMKSCSPAGFPMLGYKSNK
ncbi:L-type lectin-domain containing receptor kinase VIII.1 [Cryptomeria japonica]|uniref:L-type lectin-domain containing receptor kinase VIII.1 n=1 Tax=Cryptomeria japonica TaxID=3369 RepID=UPI0025AC43A4|nr:L-type lectin-domain containing receptor kinase VIII.1 [Cryptomeria japonica]